MRLYLYYAAHSFVNQIKKLFRSWVAIFILVCFLFGVIIGVGAAILGDAYTEDNPEQTEQTEQTEAADSQEEPAGGEDESFGKENAKAVMGLAVTGILLVMFLFYIWRSDKSGSQIFLMADVNLLFSAPKKPQSVLMFRLMSQIFVLIFAGCYLGFQIPNLVNNLGLAVGTAVSLVLAWVFAIVYSQLISVLVYTVTSTHTRLKRYITPFVLVVIGLIVGSFSLYYFTSGKPLFESLDSFFNGGFANWIPVIGWIKGMVVFSMDGNLAMSLVCIGLLILGIVLIPLAVWRIPADFYEDAMAGSQIREERMAAARAGIAARRRSKDRGDNVRRDGLWGSGANMFFTKTLYNRFRFAILKVFSKTSLFYLALALIVSVFMVFVLKTRNFYVAGFGLCVIVFFRSLANPLSTDMEKPYFLMVPASSHAKVMWSSLGGLVDCALDLLPALILSAVFLRGPVPVVIGMFLLALSLNFYVSQVLLLLDLTLPSSIAPQVKQAISVMFVYFGLVPPIAAVAVFGLFFSLTVAAYLAAVLVLLIGLMVFAFSPLILDRGKK